MHTPVCYFRTCLCFRATVAATYIIDEPTNCLSHSYDISHLFSRLQFLFRCNINVTHELVFLCFQRSPPQNSKVCTCGNLKEHATTLLRLLLLLLMRWPKPASPAVKGDCSDHLDAVNSIFFSQRSHDEDKIPARRQTKGVKDFFSWQLHVLPLFFTTGECCEKHSLQVLEAGSKDIQTL